MFLEPVDNGSVKQQMIRVGTTSGHSIEALDPIPGKSYDVYVADEGFQILGKKTYRIPDAPEFKNGKMTKKSAKISMEPRKMRSGGDRKKDTKKVKKLVASEIRDGLDNKSTVYGVKYNIRMPQLAKGREFFTTIAMEAPNGFMFTVVADTLSFDRVKNGYQNLWFYMIGDTFFDYLYRNTGEIPTGNYKVSLFWDGMWVNTSTFSVK